MPLFYLKKWSVRVSLFGVLVLGMGRTGFSQNLDNLGDKKPFKAGGALALNTSFFESNRENNFPFGKTSPFQWSIVGTPWVSLYDFMIPFTFTIGKQNSTFEHPFFQFGLSPTYKWATLHLGYRNMTFNPYTLAGHTFTGVGIELNPKKFRFAAMWGRMRQAVAFDTNASVFQIPSYKRNGFGGKIGYGTKSNFVDLMFFKAKDQIGSIPDPPNTQQITPSENLTLGISSQQKISNSLDWYGDFGLSLYTRDLRMTDTYYQLPESINKFSAIFKPNLSSRANMAFKTGANLNIKNFRLGAEYEQIDPAYETMGSYFFANDLRKIQVTPSFAFAKNKVRFNSTYALHWNNLANTRLQTTFRQNTSLNLDISPKPKYGINLSYNNFRTYQEAGTVSLNDTVAINMNTNVFTVMPRITFIKPELVQNYMLVINYQNLVDNNNFTRFFTETSSLNINLNGVFNVVKKKYSFNTGLNYLKIQGSNIDNYRYGVSLGYNTKILKEKINLRLQTNFSLNNDKGAFNGHTETFNVQMGYTVSKKHSFSLNANVLNNSFKTSNSYTEFRANVSYIFTIATSAKKKKKTEEATTN